MSPDTHTATAASSPHVRTPASQPAAPNPLWVITVGMAVFFAVGAAIVAVI